ncbi:hydrolase [Bacillus sp. FJAT-45350]|uniref:hydrolase n=1 Tax=Bacillus sp. FJAT-45350 TaxID=2011014 RepID=UPI000BB91492|nr:hydrolase [Bacillus sp. FJAT-45350]
MLIKVNTALVVIDVQGKLAHMMHDKEKFIKNVQIMIQGARAMNLPIIVLEQYPKGLGKTIPEVASLLEEEPIEKISFGACLNQQFIDSVQALNRKQLLIVGMEAHVCVYQTVMGLLENNFAVEVVSDAVSSRVYENKQIGLQRMQDGGAKITSTEMCLFELMKVAEGKIFKDIIKLLK